MVTSLFSVGWGVRLAGAGLLALAGWLAVYDVARRTVRQSGLTRYMAVCLLTGYVWLAVAGGLWLGFGTLDDGPAYDAMLHALFLGFVIAMVCSRTPRSSSPRSSGRRCRTGCTSTAPWHCCRPRCCCASPAGTWSAAVPG